MVKLNAKSWQATTQSRDNKKMKYKETRETIAQTKTNESIFLYWIHVARCIPRQIPYDKKINRNIQFNGMYLFTVLPHFSKN